jgi:hypothetical protein
MEKSERPLRVLVAEALGWTDCKVAEYPRPTAIPDDHWPTWHGHPSVGTWPWWMQDAHEQTEKARPAVPHYELEWQTTGPLIEKYHIGLVYSQSEPAETNPNDWCAFQWPKGEWTQFPGDDEEGPAELAGPLVLDGSAPDAATGATPLLAVCALILKLKEAGKL